LLAAKAVALGRSGDLQEALAFSDASIEERGDTPYIWLARGDVLLARKEPRANYCFDKALRAVTRKLVCGVAGGADSLLYKQFALALKLAQQAVELNAGIFCPARTRPLPARARVGRRGAPLLPASPTTQSPSFRGQRGTGQAFRNRALVATARLVAAAFQTMSTEKLNRFLSRPTTTMLLTFTW